MTPLEAGLTAALAASQRQVAELKQENELLRQKIDAELSEELPNLAPEEAAVLAFLRARLADES